MSTWRNTLEDWLGEITVDCKSVLDVGGGANPVVTRVKKWYVEEYYIWDNGNEPHTAVGDTTMKDYKIFEMDIAANMVIAGDKRYDVVFCLETIMYTTDPAQAMRNLISLTKDTLYISNAGLGYPETRPAGTDMVRLTPNFYKHHLEDAGFDTIIREVYPEKQGSQDLLGAYYTNEGLKVEKPHAMGYLIKAMR